MSERDQRRDHETRALIERVAEAAANRAIEKFGDLTPHDLSKKEGRDNFRADMSHSHVLRRGCEAMKGDGAALARRGAWTLIFIVIVAGLAWVLGINPAKIKFLSGNLP